MSVPAQEPETAFKVTVRDGEYVDASQVVELRAEDFVRRLAELAPGRHKWVIGLIHAIDDPEKALDQMTLGGDTLLGFYPIHCLGCLNLYRDLEEQGFPACDRTATAQFLPTA